MANPDERSFATFLGRIELYASQTGRRLTPCGSKEEEIQEFEALTAHTLPPFYKEYLRVFGEDDGGLDILPRRTNLQSLIRRYRRWADDEITHAKVPRGCVLIGGDGIEDNVVLVLSNGQDARSAQVAASWDDEILSPLSRSLDTWMFAWMDMTQRPHYSQRHLVRHTPAGASQIVTAVAAHGMSPLWFTDDRIGVLEGEAAWVQYHYHGDLLDVMFDIADPSLLLQVSSAVLEAVSL